MHLVELSRCLRIRQKLLCRCPQQRQIGRIKVQQDAILQKLHDENDSRRNAGKELLNVDEEAAKNPLFKPIVHSSICTHAVALAL